MKELKVGSSWFFFFFALKGILLERNAIKSLLGHHVEDS